MAKKLTPRPSRAQVQAALRYWQVMCKPPDPPHDSARMAAGAGETGLDNKRDVNTPGTGPGKAAV